MVTCYIFDHIPATHPSWMLAVFAINEKDAREYIKRYHVTGKLLRSIDSGHVKADCGAVTEKARGL